MRGITLSGEWKPIELSELKSVLDPLPKKWVEDNPRFNVLARESVLTNAPASAPGHSKYDPKSATIVVYDKGVYHGGKLDKEQFRRSIYHELAHSILRDKPGIIDSWRQSTDGDGFVDEYAKTSPDEDFADTFSEFFIQNGKTKKVVPRKAAFLKQLLAQEKVAMNLNSFVDEITKTASSASALKKMLSMAGRAGKMPGAKGAVLAGGGLAAGGLVGTKKGRESGYEAGTSDLVDVAKRSRMLGRYEGVKAYQRYITNRMKGQGRPASK